MLLPPSIFLVLSYVSGATGLLTLPNGNCQPGEIVGCTTGLRSVVNNWVAGGQQKTTVIEQYGKISEWDTSKITNMDRIFSALSSGFDTANFNADLSKWDVARVTTMNGMFDFALEFESDLSKWQTGAVTDMQYMFKLNSDFNSDLSKWQTGAVTNMQYMFDYTPVFNSDLSKWNVARVTNLEGMFKLTGVFNSDLSKWQTGAVTNMDGVFKFAVQFNSDLSKWQTSAVTTMNKMFFNAPVFNSDLSMWDTTAVVDMQGIFDLNSMFKQTLCGGQWSLYFKTKSSGSNGRLGCCAAGTFMSAPTLDPFTTATACSTCPSETFSTKSATLSCVYTASSCPIGTYASGDASCLTCEKGKYNGDTGQADCVGCAVGQFAAESGQLVCALCPSGWFNTQPESTQCWAIIEPGFIAAIVIGSLVVVGVVAFVCHRHRLKAQLNRKDEENDVQLSILNVAFGVVAEDNSKLKRAWIVQLAGTFLCSLV